MADIVERLRSTCKADKDCSHAPCFGYCLPLEAADEIERLRENDIVLFSGNKEEIARITGDVAEFIHTAAVKTFILDAVTNSACPDLSARLDIIAKTGNGRISQSEARSLSLLLELQLDKHNDDLAEEIERLSESLSNALRLLAARKEASRG